mmetsp:Transcript_43113/g.58880  ORF Transcript_43113/g.58880 Transcript_43113/m.58880 type:complete len:208 (-) Transcript_43113:54-677(-)
MQSVVGVHPRFHTQVVALTRRSLSTTLGATLKPLNIILTTSLAAILGLLWFQIGSSHPHMADSADDVISIIFCLTGQWVWGPAFTTLNAFPQDRDVLVKELASDTYSVEAYFISKIVTEIPVSTILPSVYYLVNIIPLVLSQRRSLALFCLHVTNHTISASLSNDVSPAEWGGEGPYSLTYQRISHKITECHHITTVPLLCFRFSGL